MSAFTRDLDVLMSVFNTQKHNLIRNLEKNYRENVHYIKLPVTAAVGDMKKQNGGQNKIVYMLTEEAFELFKNSYNFRNRYIVDVSDKVKCVKFPMCIEGQTIGFIENAYRNVCNLDRQFQIGPYRTDLCFIDHFIAVECDEYGHINMSEFDEKTREDYIINQGYTLIRYNPNDAAFDLSDVLSKINVSLIMKGAFIK